MFSSNLDFELQCEWATTLAASGTASKKEIQALTKAALACKATGVKPPSRFSSSSQNRTVDESRIRCLIPLCNFLLESNGQFADYLIPELLNRFQTLPEAFNLNPTSTSSFQKAVTECLLKFHEVMKLNSVSGALTESMSRVVHDVLKKCIAPEEKVSAGPTTRYFFARALARDTQLEDHFPMLPKDAYSLLSWLHDHFYTLDADAHTITQISVDILSTGVVDKPVIWHLDDEKMMALTIPIVSAALPLEEKKADYQTSLQDQDGVKVEFSLNALTRIVSFACESVQMALEPILQSGPDRKIRLDVGPQAGMSFSIRQKAPSADLVRAASKLATRLVHRLWEYQKTGHFNVKDDFSTVKNEVSKVVDIMLQVAEICLEAAWESGAVYILGIAKHMLTETMQLVSAGVSLGDSMNDTLSRLRTFMLKAIRLVEEGGSFELSMSSSHGSGKSRGSGNSPAASNFALEWDISRSFIDQKSVVVDSPIMELCSVSSEALCMTLADGWKADQRADVRGVAIPLGNIMIASTISSSCGDRQIAALCLGRLFVLVGGDPDMARLLLPLLMDGMLGSENGTPTPVYACLLHVLATIGGVSGRSGFPWALNQVLEQMIKLYKDPKGVVSNGLMYATGHEGRQKGCMASAFLQLAKLLQTAKIGIRKTLRLKLLALFSDFGLRACELRAVYDLGALLPAIAASCENLDEALPSMITWQTAKSLQEMESQVSDVSLIRHFRNLWMYSAIYKFSGLCHRGAPEWPKAWPEALGTIAAATPALSGIDGWQKSESDQERLRPELKDRLSRAGPNADVLSLGTLLRDLVAPFGNNLNGTQLESAGCAYLLAVATLELSRAALSPLPGPLETAPMSSIMSYLSVVVIHNPEAPWLRAIGDQVFLHYLKRLSGSFELGIGDGVSIKRCQESLALTLINGLATGSCHTQGDYPQVADLSNTLLEQLVKAVPSLYWNGQCLNQLLNNLDQEECASVMIEGGDVRTEGLVWNWVIHWIDAIATMAPTRAEAIIHEYLRDDSVPENRVLLRHAPELLSRCSKAGHKQSQAEKEGARRFMQSLAQKSYYIGRVSGFNDDLDQRSAPDQQIVERVVESLKQSVINKQFCPKVEQKYLQAAATLVLCIPFSTPQNLLRAICWTPVQIFNPDMMQLATFSWEWVLTKSFSLNISMLVEIMDAWIWTINKKLGIFTGSKCEISPSALQEIDDSAQSSSIAGIKAHSLWLSFLLEQWEVSCQAPSDTLMAHTGIFARLLMHSLHHPHSLSHHPAAAGARFKLLTLGLKYCQFFADGNSDNVTAAVLYERIIRAGLSWFEYPQSWYGQRTRIEGEEEVTAVKTFTELLAQWPRKSNLNGRHIAKSAKLLASVWHLKTWNRDMSDSRRDLLVHLCRREIERLQVWVCPIPHADLSAVRVSCDWAKYVNAAWNVHPRLALGLINRYPKIPSIENELFSLINKNAAEVMVQSLPQAGIILATSDPIKRLKASQRLELLKHWAPASLNEAMFLLTTDTTRYPIIKAFIISSLDKANPEQLAFYLPQLVQGLRNDNDSALQYLLRHKASQSWVFCHRLMWYLRSEFKPSSEEMNPEIKRSGWKAPSDTGLWTITAKLHSRVLGDLDEDQKTFLDAEMGYFDKITSISGALKKVPADESRGKIEELLRAIQLERQDLYLPTNPGSIVKQVVSDSGTLMPSKEKKPILVQFLVTNEQSSNQDGDSSDKPSVKKQACIFKVGDDVRQDVLALQIIKILKDVYLKAGLDLYLCPYGVIPTGYEKGVIEVVPNSKSRSALGETTDGGLYEIFQREFGIPGSKKFEAARHNFMVSEAGYAIASYLLQCKDRHNGNILIDSEGHLVHIDFGFILEISPGNNMKFENADFKLSHEMTQLLDPGGMKSSQFYHRFEEMCIRAFLAARSVAEPIITCVALMKYSGLPCFEIGNAVANLRTRFLLDKTEKQAAANIKAMVLNAYCKWTTSYYDKLQKYTY